MKIFRFFEMALVTICMCVNFTACSSGDDADSGGFAGERKLVKMVMGDGDDTDVVAFNYDNQGRLVEIDGETYIWGNNTIQAGGTIYTIENGLIQQRERVRAIMMMKTVFEYILTTMQADAMIIWFGMAID